ncbi:hypothetical protein GXW74_19925 [Roseomonas eburnea]|uniref:Uncharacterized protein n=1 Tax=Neoroseomonas eburnea TaxID=1346889 RepID=A0A9X9XGD5_9PROT|nr:hypothetical protein [Neoroseomonas eburnea]MBR0682771.1 hypothetical protein [Neoroseomonas eburnea]
MAAARAEAEARVRLAEDELYRVQQADDFAFTNGSYDRALRCLREARQALTDVLADEAARMAREVSATCSAISTDLSRIKKEVSL